MHNPKSTFKLESDRRPMTVPSFIVFMIYDLTTLKLEVVNEGR